MKLTIEQIRLAHFSYPFFISANADQLDPEHNFAYAGTVWTMNCGYPYEMLVDKEKALLIVQFGGERFFVRKFVWPVYMREVVSGLYEAFEDTYPDEVIGFKVFSHPVLTEAELCLKGSNQRRKVSDSNRPDSQESV